MMPQQIEGFAQIVDRFAGLVVDQFGVLHDGTRVYPCVEQCLRRLEDAGKRMVVLSNSGRRAADNCRRLAALGLPTAQFEAVITSGEVAWSALATRTDAFHRTLGRRCLLLAEDGDQSFLDGLDLDAVGTAADADFVLVVGIDTPQRSLADYDAELALAARRNLPLLCANSDLVRLTPSGLQPAPGALARRYTELGGRVHGYGKPLRPIFDQSLAALDGIARDCVLVVGDSLDHDILGAQGAGIGSVYVRGGVGASIDDATMDAAMRALDARPCYVMQEFRW